MTRDEAVVAVRAIDANATYTEVLRYDASGRVFEVSIIVPLLERIGGAVNDSGDPAGDDGARDDAIGSVQ